MPSEAEHGIAGVRVAGGRLMFVTGAPADLPIGAAVRLQDSSTELTGIVSIPPGLVLWCDPTVECARFIRRDTQQEQLRSPVNDSDSAGTLLALDTAPDPHTMAAMLALAREDLARLNDE